MSIRYENQYHDAHSKTITKWQSFPTQEIQYISVLTTLKPINEINSNSTLFWWTCLMQWSGVPKRKTRSSLKRQLTFGHYFNSQFLLDLSFLKAILSKKSCETVYYVGFAFASFYHCEKILSLLRKTLHLVEGWKGNFYLSLLVKVNKNSIHQSPPDPRSRTKNGSIYQIMTRTRNFLQKKLEDISRFCGATGTSVLDFWWRLPYVSKPVDPLTQVFWRLHIMDSFDSPLV